MHLPIFTELSEFAVWGKAGIAFDCFQQMKVTIGAARVIEKEPRALLLRYEKSCEARICLPGEKKSSKHRGFPCCHALEISRLHISRQDAPAYFITFQDVWMSLNVSISLNTYLHFAQMLQWALGCQHVTRQPPLWMETRAELLMECAYK